MSNIGTQYSNRSLFPVEWPLASKIGVTSQTLKKQEQRTKGIKKRKTRKLRRRLGTNQSIRCVAQAMTADQQTQTDEKQENARDTDGGSNEIEYKTRSTSVGPTHDVIYEPAMPCAAAPNIFESLDRDEARWLAEEVHQANKSVFRQESGAERLNNTEMDNKKASLDTLKNLLKDLRRNIKYPDEETAKDLDNLDEASGNFGVRNMINYLNLLDNYFSNLQTQLNE